MKLEVYNISNEKVGDIDLQDSIFGAEVKPHLHHEVVLYQLSKRRAGTHQAKTRGEINATTRKMYKQKGTGRARHGSRRAPTMVGGGKAFGPRPRTYDYAVPKKVRRGALRSALSEKMAAGKIKIIDQWSLEAPKSKAASQSLQALGTLNALVVDVDNQNLRLSVRNLANAKFLLSKGINVYDILKYENLILTKDAVVAIEGALS